MRFELKHRNKKCGYNQNVQTSSQLKTALHGIELLNETFHCIEMRIAWELEQLEQRINKNRDPVVTKEIKEALKDFLEDLLNRLEK